MKILGINISHNPSICLLDDGKVLSFYDETRFIKNKSYNALYDENEQLRYKSIDDKIYQNVDHIVFASYGNVMYDVDIRYNQYSLEYQKVLLVKHLEPLTIQKFEKQLAEKFPKIKEYKYYNQHHVYHAVCGYNFSNFDDAICIVMDGGGATCYPNVMPTYQEIESVYYINQKEIKELHKHLSNVRGEQFQYLVPNMRNKSIHEQTSDGCNYVFSSKKSSGELFSELTSYLQLADNPDDSGAGSGKTMGLAAYGKPYGNRPQDLAYKLQIETEKNTIKLIDYASRLVDCKNIILSGGYALNCLNNYKYVKKFPHLNFFVDPCAHDGGTSIGAALWYHRKLNNYV